MSVIVDGMGVQLSGRPAMNLELKNRLHDLEVRLHLDETRRDAAQLAALLADDFVEFATSGGVWTKVQVIEALLRDGPFTAPVVSEFTTRELAGELVLVTYRSTAHDHVTLRSSIWRSGPGGWRMTFHQGTRVPA